MCCKRKTFLRTISTKEITYSHASRLSELIVGDSLTSFSLLQHRSSPSWHGPEQCALSLLPVGFINDTWLICIFGLVFKIYVLCFHFGFLHRVSVHQHAHHARMWHINGPHKTPQKLFFSSFLCCFLCFLALLFKCCLTLRDLRK